MKQALFDYLNQSKTAYHAVQNAQNLLNKAGFTPLFEGERWNLARGGKYYVIKDGSAMVAFVVGQNSGFYTVASHTDSPCMKIKLSPEQTVDCYTKLNVERYGGGIFYSWLDTPVTISGRVILSNGKQITSKIFTSAHTFVIPSVAIHYNRTVNDGIKLNAQTDLSPLISLGDSKGLTQELQQFAGENTILDYDLYVVSATDPFACGYTGELFSAPRIDNLTSAYASICALVNATPAATAVAYLADNEEVGSKTKQGADSTFLRDVLCRINTCLGGDCQDLQTALYQSFMISCDNAHALHPNHPELSDATNKTVLGGGVVIKHHGNQNYTTDGVSSAVMQLLCQKSGASYQHFFMRSDLPCGGTLGAISSSQVSVRSVDIGIPQLAMHSAVETASLLDFKALVAVLTAFYSAKITATATDKITVE